VDISLEASPTTILGYTCSISYSSEKSTDLHRLNLNSSLRDRVGLERGFPYSEAYKKRSTDGTAKTRMFPIFD